MNDRLAAVSSIPDLSAGGTRAAQHQQALLHMQREQAMQARVTALQLAIQLYAPQGGGPTQVTEAATQFEAFIAGAPGELLSKDQPQ
jgi:hypothetical protein